MTRTFIQTNEFSKNWDILGFDDEDLRLLELSLLEYPEKYPIMKGTGGLRKARISMGRKGQSFHNRTKSNQKDDWYAKKDLRGGT